MPEAYIPDIRQGRKEAVAEGVFGADTPLRDPSRWNDLGESDGDGIFARAALGKAQRMLGIDGRLAYMVGVSDGHAAFARQQSSEAIIDSDPDQVVRDIALEAVAQQLFNPDELKGGHLQVA